uniref:Putative methyltransferase n=1 Tax=viral metagenome TaxID=1070528 RepID=A0A6H1Z7I0_9ZZZZ
MFKTISMDPPWPEFGGGKIKRGAQAHYGLIRTKEEILRVILQATSPCMVFDPIGRPMQTERGVWQPDPEGCLLWMWATRNHLPMAFWLIEALGFRYVTDFVWVKGGPLRQLIIEGGRLSQDSLKQLRGVVKLAKGGLGQWSTSQHEHLLMARIGKVDKPAPQDRMPSVIVAPREEHSVKPAVFYDWMEKLGPEGPRLEMFARGPQEGWTVWGDQA